MLRKVGKCLICAGVVVLALSVNVRAEYKPPDTGRQQQNKSAGSRGCSESLPTIILAAPDNHIAQTMRDNPVFFVKISKASSEPVLISVYDPNQIDAFWKQELQLLPQEWTKVTVPRLPLEINKNYVVNLSIPCGGLISSGQTLQLLFKKAASPTTSKNLNFEQLAESGIWYDALFLAYEQNRDAFMQYLENIGL